MLPTDSLSDWNVFSPDGRWLGTVTLPADLTFFEAGQDYVLGLRRDALDVERVVLYRLVKPGGDASGLWP